MIDSERSRNARDDLETLSLFRESCSTGSQYRLSDYSISQWRDMSGIGTQPNISDPQTLVLECSICTDQYGQDFDHIPRSLRCGHTFCSKCLLKIMMSRGVRCPICSVEHPVSTPDVTQIPVNYAVLEIIRNIAGTKEVLDEGDDNMPQCQVCSKKKAQVACIDCQPGVKFLFCHSCDQHEHNRSFRPVQGHRRYPVDRVPNSVYICTRHRTTPATMFSMSMFEFACTECQKDPDWTTRSKVFVPIPEALSRLRSSSQKLNIYSLNVISQLKDAKHKMKVIIEKLDPSASTAKQDIQVKFGAIMDLIQTRQQELLDYVETESVSRKQRLQEQLEQILVSIKMYRDAYEDLNTLISKSDLEFLLSYQVVTEKVEALLASEDKSLHRPAITEEIPFFIPKDIQQQLKTLGAVGGGVTPAELECVANNSKGNVMQLNWQLPKSAGRVLHFQIEYEHLPDSSPFHMDSSQLDAVYNQGEPHLHQVTGNELSAFIDYLCPSYQYRFRIRSANAAGWGMWSKPVIGRCEDFPVIIRFTKKINRIRIPVKGYYRITAKGAKAADGKMHSGGSGAIMSAAFFLNAGDVLIILCGGMSVLQKFSTGGGGGTFVAVNEINQDNLLIAAGGGGGTRGVDENDFDGCNASLEPQGLDGLGREHGKGGVNSGPGEDANPVDYQSPCWGHGGAGFLQDSTTASSFLKGGHGGQCGGFGGGGSIGQYGGGGGGGYSGGGGGRGGGGGGSYIRADGINIRKEVGNDSSGSVMVEREQEPPYPNHGEVLRSDSNMTVSSGYSTQAPSSYLQSQMSHASSANSNNDTKVAPQNVRESACGTKSPEESTANRPPSSHSSPLNTGIIDPQMPATNNMMPVREVVDRNWIEGLEPANLTMSNAAVASSVSSEDSNSVSTLIDQYSGASNTQIPFLPQVGAPNQVDITHTNDRNSSLTASTIRTEDPNHLQGAAARPTAHNASVSPHPPYPPHQNQ